MEWVVTTARTVAEAKGLALDQLGVADDDAEYEILDEPKAGLFGRMRGEAKVRARVRPTQARMKVERRDRKRRPEVDGAGSSSRTESVDSARTPRPPRPDRSEPRPSRVARETPPASASGALATASDDQQEITVDARHVGDQARQFVDELVTAFGFTASTTLVEDGSELEVHVDGADLGLLVGPRGSTLQAIQDLARVASQRRLGDHDTHLRVDVGGYRLRRREALARFALQVADDVKQSATSRALEPMPSADRKVIHDTLASVEGVATRSEGDDPFRRIVIDPADG